MAGVFAAQRDDEDVELGKSRKVSFLRAIFRCQESKWNSHITIEQKVFSFKVLICDGRLVQTSFNQRLKGVVI